MADFAPPKKEELNDMFAPPDEDEMQRADVPQIPNERMPDPLIEGDEGPLSGQRWAQTIWRTSTTLPKLQKAFPAYTWAENPEDGITYEDKSTGKKWALDPARPEFKDLIDIADEIIIGGASTIAGKVAGGAAAVLAAATTGPVAPATVPGAYLAAERLATGATEAAGEAGRQFGSNLLGYSDGYDTGDIATAGAVGLAPLPFDSPGLTKGASQSLMRKGYDPIAVSQPIQGTIKAVDNYLPVFAGGPTPSVMKQGKKYVPDVPTRTGRRPEYPVEEGEVPDLLKITEKDIAELPQPKPEYIPGIRTLEKNYDNPIDHATAKFQSDANATMGGIKDAIWGKMKTALDTANQPVDFGKAYGILKAEKNRLIKLDETVGLKRSESRKLEVVEGIIKDHFERVQKIKNPVTGEIEPKVIPITEASAQEAFETRSELRDFMKYDIDSLPAAEKYEQSLYRQIYPELTNSIDTAVKKAVSSNPALAADPSFSNLSTQYAQTKVLNKNLSRAGIVRPDFDDISSGVESLDNVYGKTTRDAADKLMALSKGKISSKKEGLLNDLKTLDKASQDFGLGLTQLPEQAQVISAFSNWGGSQKKIGNLYTPSFYSAVALGNNTQNMTNALPMIAASVGGSVVGSPGFQKGLMRNPLLSAEKKHLLAAPARAAYMDAAQQHRPEAMDLYTQIMNMERPPHQVDESKPGMFDNLKKNFGTTPFSMPPIR